MKIKAIIIEDEALVAKNLKNLLSRIVPEMEVDQILSSVAEAVSYFENGNIPDLAFMDIQLGDGVSFDIFDQTQVTCPVIFTTAYDQYAIQAFKVNSIDYLLKPVDEEDLLNALEKFKQISDKGESMDEKIRSLIQTLQPGSEKKYKQRFMVHTRNTNMPIPVENIAYFSKEELIYVYTMDNHRYLSENHSMDEIESLCNPASFFRANRQYIVQIEAVERIKSSYNGKIIAVLKPPHATEIDISREKAAEFKRWLDS